MHGQGRLIVLGKNKQGGLTEEKYVGLFKGGKKHGVNATETMQTWDSSKDSREGAATSSMEYRGKFLNGKKSTDSGTMQWMNGDRYVGPWLLGLRGGKGKGTMMWHDSNGKKKKEYVGGWVSGMEEGDGEMTWVLEGRKEIGTFL